MGGKLRPRFERTWRKESEDDAKEVVVMVNVVHSIVI